MRSVFVWTLSDLLAALLVAALVVGWLVIQFDAWRRRRRARGSGKR